MTLLGQFQFRRDTYANWISANPVLVLGELALETDTLRLKVGDGSTVWSGLDYFYTTTTVNNQSGASYTLALADIQAYVRMTSASANTVTVPPNSSVAFPVGIKVMIRQAGAGATTIVAGGGVTINGTLVLPGQNTTIVLLKIDTDTWDVI